MIKEGLWDILPIAGLIVEKVVGPVDQTVSDKDLAEKMETELQTQLRTLQYGVPKKK